jgi:hypothetical protein
MVALSSQVALGQTLTARSSSLNYAYVYGAGGDSHVGNDTVGDTLLLLSDAEHAEYDGGTSGVLPGDPPHPYSAAAGIDLDHQYVITEELGEMRSIIASGSSVPVTTVSGAGISQMNSGNPGNQLMFSFTVASPVLCHLSGSLDLPAPTAFSGIVLQRFNGIFWESWFNTISLPGTEGPFDVLLSLIPGDYRIIATLGVSAQNGVDETANYQFTVVFEKKADMNCDGKVNGLDVKAFVEALLNPGAYSVNYAGCNPLNGDMDNNVVLNFDDAGLFADYVINN